MNEKGSQWVIMQDIGHWDQSHDEVAMSAMGDRAEESRLLA
jgi:hypothetical protein